MIGVIGEVKRVKEGTHPLPSGPKATGVVAFLVRFFARHHFFFECWKSWSRFYQSIERSILLPPLLSPTPSHIYLPPPLASKRLPSQWPPIPSSMASYSLVRAEQGTKTKKGRERGVSARSARPASLRPPIGRAKRARLVKAARV